MFRKIIFMMFLAGMTQAQEVIDMNVETLFRKNYKSWISTPTDSTFKVITSTSNADTFETSAFPTYKGSGEIYLNARVVAQLGDSVNSKLQVGLYRGKGVMRSYGIDGYEWIDLLSFNAIGESEYVLKDLGAVSDKPFSKYKFRWIETGAQSNQYVTWVHHYKPGGR